MKKESNFLKEIEYNEYLSDMVYLVDKKLIDEKIHFPNTYQVVEGHYDLGDTLKWPSCIRKGVFVEEKGKGVIIGQCSRREGIYHPYIPAGTWGEDYEPAWLEVKRTLKLWVVATKMNRTVLVEKI